MEANDKTFNRYIQNILHVKGDSRATVEDRINDQNRITLIFGTILTASVNLFWLLYDIFTGKKMGMLTPIGLVSTIPIIITSILFLITLLKHSGKNLTSRIFIYYLVLSASISASAITKNIQMVNSGTVSSYNGLSLSSFLFFLPVFAPLADMKHSVILWIVCLLSVFVPAFCPGKEASQIPANIVLSACFITTYFYIRNIQVHTARVDLENSCLNRKLLLISYHDSLTGALNRRALDEYVDALIKDPAVTPISVIMMDIDDFKSYNDFYLHSEGDKVLQNIARTIQNTLGPDGPYLFRYGREDFCILIPNCSEPELLTTVTSIQKSIRSAAFPREDIAERSVLSITIGCAVVNSPVDTEEDLIREADDRLYLGKRSGKDCIVIKDRIYRE